ncbi:MAG: hypothetical protein RIR69_232, partial [Actinomycetota bacterium]
ITHAINEQDTPSIPRGKCARFAGKAGTYSNISGEKPNEIVVLGKSTQGRNIFAEHWGSRSGPQILVIGQVHGNECTPSYLVHELRANPSDDVGVWIIPTLNPDGLARHSRKNARGIDLNRDGYRRQAVETRLLFKFVKRYRPVLSVHVHSPSGWVGHFNGGLAKAACRDISSRTGLKCSAAGRASHLGGAFLWEGLARHVAGHESLLVELPRVSSREASSAPRHLVMQASQKATRTYAREIRRSLLETIAR